MADEAGSHSDATVAPGAFTSLLRKLAAAPEVGPDGGWDARLRAGSVFGRFELVRELGRGGFGVVWEAKDRLLGRAVAFKALRPGAPRSLREERVVEEAEAAAHLSHPNIVTLHDFGEAEPGPYLVLELLRGETLGTRLAREELPVAAALSVAREVAKGLAHAHARSVVHRDLKPENVFLCEDGQVKVLDFGLAQAFGRRKVEGGTGGFMAPEQQRGAPEDERTDVFALGVMLHRLLAGRLPFESDAPDGSGPVAAPRLEVAAAPSLGPLVARMLAWDPVERPRDGAEVVHDLAVVERELAAAAPEMASAPARSAPAVTSPRVRRRLVLAAVVLGLAAAAVVAWRVLAGRPAPQAEGEASIAVLPFVDMSAAKDQEYLADGLAEEILNALSRIEGLKVIGRTSSFSFKGKSVALPEIAAKLGVTSILEGSVRRDGNRLRVTAQLVRAADGARVWSERYDRELAGVLAVEDEVAREVARSLRGRLAAAGPPPREVVPEAYTLYLQAKHLRSTTIDPIEHRGDARRALEKAVELDPGFAAAWAALSGARSPRSGEATKLETRGVLDAAERAIALAPSLGDGYQARAWSRLAFELDWVGARADAQRALQLDPSSTNTLARLAQILLGEGRLREALVLIRRAAELEPLNASWWWMLGYTLKAAGDLGGARAALERALAVAPDDDAVRQQLVELDLLAGDPARVLKAVEVERDEEARLYWTTMALHSLGHHDTAERGLGEWNARFASSDPQLACDINAWLGHRDRAFEALDRILVEPFRHGGAIAYLRVDPLLASLRSDPRWKAFLRKASLPVEVEPAPLPPRPP